MNTTCGKYNKYNYFLNRSILKEKPSPDSQMPELSKSVGQNEEGRGAKEERRS